jgi:hypothetical protein
MATRPSRAGLRGAAIVASAAAGFLVTAHGLTPTEGAAGRPARDPGEAVAPASPRPTRTSGGPPARAPAPLSEATRGPAREAPQGAEPPRSSTWRALSAAFDGSDPIDRTLLALASQSAAPTPPTLAPLRQDPDRALAAIERALGRLPDPETGTGPAAEILLRIAADRLGLDRRARLELLTRELVTAPTAARPRRPEAALDLLVATEPAEAIEDLLLTALRANPDLRTRQELLLRFAAAHPERAEALERRAAGSGG